MTHEDEKTGGLVPLPYPAAPRRRRKVSPGTDNTTPPEPEEKVWWVEMGLLVNRRSKSQAATWSLLATDKAGRAKFAVQARVAWAVIALGVGLLLSLPSHARDFLTGFFR